LQLLGPIIPSFHISIFPYFHYSTLKTSPSHNHLLVFCDRKLGDKGLTYFPTPTRFPCGFIPSLDGTAHRCERQVQPPCQGCHGHPQLNSTLITQQISVDYRRPHFYHATVNEDCPLSVLGGQWTIKEDDNVSFSSGLYGGEELVFPKNARPDLSKIPPELIEKSYFTKHISEAGIKIRLRSSDLTQLDKTIALLFSFFRQEKSVILLVIPLPTVIPKGSTGEMNPRIHKRLVKLIGDTPDLAEELTRINISENIDILVDLS